MCYLILIFTMGEVGVPILVALFRKYFRCCPSSVSVYLIQGYIESRAHPGKHGVQARGHHERGGCQLQ